MFVILPLFVCLLAKETIWQICPQQQAASESKSELIDWKVKAQPHWSDFQHLAMQCSLLLPEWSLSGWGSPLWIIEGLGNKEKLLVQMRSFQKGWQLDIFAHHLLGEKLQPVFNLRVYLFVHGRKDTVKITDRRQMMFSCTHSHLDAHLPSAWTPVFSRM